MKKLLALLLAILMVIPATLVPVSAAEVTAEGVKTNNCCEILVTDFKNKDAFGDITGADLTVGMLDGYHAISLTSLEGSSSGTGFKLAYFRNRDTAFAAFEDTSEMTHIVFDLYISDASKVIDQQKIYLELGSDNRPDHYEIHFANTLDQLVGKTLKSGWNHVELPISYMTASSPEAYYPAGWDFFRFYNNGAFPADVKLGLANMYFMNANCEEHYSHASYSFRVNGKDESIFRVTDGNISNSSGVAETDTAEGYRFMDQTNVQVYAFNGIDGDRISHASITTKTSQQLAIWVAKSFNGPWAEVYMYQTTYMNEHGAEDPDGSQLGTASRTYDLTAALNTLPGDSDMLYIKIGDSYPGGGWGGKITGAFQLDVRYDESIPEYVEDTAEYTFEVLSADEGAYLYEDKAAVAQNGGTLNYFNYCRHSDQKQYFVYRYPLGNAKNADALYWTASSRNQLKLSVSTDNATWVDVISMTANLPDTRRAYDLLTALKSDANTATTADYLYVRIADATETDGYGGALGAATTVTLHATVNDDVDVRAYDDDAFLLFTQDEKDHIIHDSSRGQCPTNGTASGSLVGLSSNAPLIDLANNANNLNHYTFKYNDNSAHMIYAYQISVDHLLSADSLTWHAYMGNEILISLSVDEGATWVDLYNSTDHTDHYVTVDLLSVEGVRKMLLTANGSFLIKISDGLTVTANGYGAKLHGYEAKIYEDKDANNSTVKNTYPGKPYPVRLTLEYDANTAGKTASAVTNEFNYVGEPIYKENTGTDKATYPYLADMPADPNEPLYTGLDTAGTQIQTGRMSTDIKKKDNTTTQAGGVFDGNWHGRFNDNNYFVYYYSIAGLDTTRDMTLSLPLGGQYGIKVAVGSSVCPQIVTTHNDATDGNTWGGDDWVFLTDYIKDGGSGNGSGGEMRTFTVDPTSFGDAINTATHIYFMFYDYNADVDPIGGYGARVGMGKIENGAPVLPVTFSYYTQTDVKGIAGASLSLTEDFNVTYSVGDIDADAAPVFSFTLGDDAAKVVTAVMEGGRLVAPFENIMPYRLAETITAKMYAKVNGVVHTFEHTYSVKDYCERMLPKSTSAEMTALLNAILAYGDTAQDYIDYRVDAKPSMGVEGYVAPTATYTPGTYTNHRALTGTPTTATWKSATLLLGSETMIALTFEAADVNGLSVLVDGEAVGFKALGNNLYRVDVPVMPNAFDQPIKACFAGNDTYVLSYSVGSYFETRYELTGDATRAMLDALYNYGVAASAFAAN